MKIEAHLKDGDLRKIGAAARRWEELGYDGMITTETAHDPFYPLLLAAEHTSRLELATAIAVAFPRSPMITAYAAWDLQSFSGGRLLLGLGTQVKGHNERRFSVPWGPPAPRLREYILALRAIWDCWQNNTRLDFRGRYYTFTLMTPFFSPGPIDHPHIPIYISAVNQVMCRLVGEICDGVRLHPFTSAKYLREAILPNIEAGASAAGRRLADIDVVGSPFIVTGADRREIEKAKAPIKRQIAFYASTRTYKPVLDIHGWGDICLHLNRMSVEGRWQEMGDLVTDEMLEEFAIVAHQSEVAGKLKERFAGLATRLTLDLPSGTPEDAERARTIIAETKRLL